MIPDAKTLDTILHRGVAEIIVEEEFVELLKAGKPLRLKMGFDPSSPDIHLGHAVGLRKLRQLQELGHQVVLIVGDWTARIGDPSGMSATRRMLTQQEVEANAETYMRQLFKVVDRAKTQAVYQSEWFGKFDLEKVIGLTSKFTVAQFLAREDFSKRYREGRPIAITELLYPLMQAYDSIAVRSDVEFGGVDQKFNLLVGRELQTMEGQRPQQCFMVPLLVGTDGVQKMSKSLGNYIGVAEAPNDMYGKTMALPDFVSVLSAKEEHFSTHHQVSGPRLRVRGAEPLILTYMDYLTDIPDEEIKKMGEALHEDAVNPMELKKRLAREIVGQFHDAEAARQAEAHFERVVQRGEAPEEIPTVSLGALQGQRLSHILVMANLASSTAAAKRLISQGAVEKNGEKLTADLVLRDLKSGDLLRVGKQGFLRVVS